eukprot:1194666-Prorocentrum_minimum.AAC.3
MMPVVNLFSIGSSSCRLERQHVGDACGLELYANSPWARAFCKGTLQLSKNFTYRGRPRRGVSLPTDPSQRNGATAA